MRGQSRTWRTWSRLALIAVTTMAMACSGDDGATGPAGAAGADGAAGVAGNAGATGAAGEAGTAGTAGAPGASGETGATGAAGVVGVPGALTGTVSGTVTNTWTDAALEGVAVDVTPAFVMDVVTDASGAYTMDLPTGAYTLVFDFDGYGVWEATLLVAAGADETLDVALEPDTEIIVDGGGDVDSAPGATVTFTPTFEALDGTSAIIDWAWEQVGGVDATLTVGDDGVLTVEFADLEAYKAFLMEELVRPDRTEVVPITPLAWEHTVAAEFEVTGSTADGDEYHADVVAHLDIALAWALGIRNVPIDVPVLLQAASDASYIWTIDAPNGSAAAFDDATSRWPIFWPDVEGIYTIGVGGGEFDIYAGTFLGAIDALDEEGRPVAGACLGCHADGAMRFDEFDQWAQTGHAEIFTQNIDNPNHHWSGGCASCHTVGYNPDADNGNFGAVWEEEGWEVPHGTGAGTYANMIEEFPEVAQLANIQCENCHGPSDSPIHTTVDADETTSARFARSDMDARSTLDSGLCASCHGEPARHARFQQWQLSGHSSYDLAIGEATVENREPSPYFGGAGHCGRCHSAQGFIAWVNAAIEEGGEDGLADVALLGLVPDLDGDTHLPLLNRTADAEDVTAYRDFLDSIGLNEANVQPQSCVTCHDPHLQGTESGEPNTATVRIAGITPLLPADFGAVEVGRGAICMTCHNTRNGQHDDSAPPSSYSGPHHSAQADILMGENLFFVNTGQRAGHALITDTCTNCHLVRTPPPEDLSHNLGGTNHTFAASTEICGDCHGDIDGDRLGHAFEAGMDDLFDVLAEAIWQDLDEAGDFYNGDAGPYDIDLTTIDGFETGHGALAIFMTVNGSDVEVHLGDLSDESEGEAYWAEDHVIVQALWNYLMLEFDGSSSIHNPGFAQDALLTTERVVFEWLCDNHTPRAESGFDCP